MPFYIKCFLFLSFFISCNKEIKCENLTYENGLTYKDGELFTGVCKSYFKNGIIKSIQQYNNGNDTSQWTFFFQNGIIETIGQFEKGIRIGEWKYYFKSGLLKQVNNYKLGKKDGIWLKFSEKGDTIYKIEFKLDSIIFQKNYK